LRFLYYTAQKDASRVKDGTSQKDASRFEEDDDVFYATLKDLALFLLSPLPGNGCLVSTFSRRHD